MFSNETFGLCNFKNNSHCVVDQNNEVNEGENSDSDESNFSDDVDSVSDDDSGYDTNVAVDDNNDVKMTDDSESEDEPVGDLDENAEGAYRELVRVKVIYGSVKHR